MEEIHLKFFFFPNTNWVILGIMYLFIKVYLPVSLYRAKHWHSSPCCAKCQQIKCVRLSVASWRKLRDERQIEGRVSQFSTFVSDDSRHEIGQFKGMVTPPSPVSYWFVGCDMRYAECQIIQVNFLDKPKARRFMGQKRTNITRGSGTSELVK